MSLPIIIAGAGIGGLSAALALAAKGHDVVVVERAEAIAEVGAGLQLSPNACHVLDLLGVLPEVKAKAVAPQALRVHAARSGAEIARIPLGEQIAARHGAPYLVIHRADLQQALYDKASAEARITFRFASQIIDSDTAASDGLYCRIRTGRNIETVPAKALIGADGVWSQTRLRIPGHADARYSGLTAYRATLPGSEVSWEYLRDTGLWLGPNAHLVHYPIRAGKEFNIVGLVPEAWTEEGWSAHADRNEFLRHFRDWAPGLRKLLEKPDTWLKWALCGVNGSRSWSSGCCTLLGDAAHAMLPFAAQGAAMAIEDAAVLASLFPVTATDIPAVLKAYESVRKPRVVQVQKTAEENGRIYHMSGPMALARNAAMRLMGQEKLASRQDWIYGWKTGI